MKNMLALLAVFFLTCSLRSDEGLYLFSHPPRQQLKEKYQYDLADSFLDKLRKSSICLDEGSASFVSPDGLILTNQHVGWRSLEELNTPSRDLVRNGFCAQQQEDELRCPGLEARVLWSMEDVTDRVHAVIKPGMNARSAYKAREAMTRTIEKESTRETGLFSEVVTLEQGGRYQLYRYKKYSDVRLVFAPEQDVLRVFDVCFFRAYEDGRPAKIKDYLPFAMTPPEQGDLVLLAGYPGSTSRFRTSADLESYYGRRFFLWFKHLGRWQDVVTDFCQQSPECDRLGRLELFGLENEFSAELHLWSSLEKQLAEKRRQEKAFADRVAKHPELLAVYRAAQERIAAAVKDEELLEANFFLEYPAAAYNSELFTAARRLVRLADEAAKPDEERLWEYSDAHRSNTCRDVLAPRVIARELEIAKLAASLQMFVESCSSEAELAKQVMAGKTPEQRARELIAGSRLDDIDVRKALLEGGTPALNESKDTMIALARLVDARSRQIRAQCAEAINEPHAQAYADLARVRAKVLGDRAYPDATLSLRLSFGRVQPFARMIGNTDSGITAISEVFRFVDASNQTGRLPSTWQKARASVNMNAPLLFSSSADAVSGNSGSPVLDRAGKLIGVCSIGSKGQELSYEDGKSGCGGIAAAGILAMLEHAYDAHRLVKELGGNTSRLPAAVVTTVGAPSLPPPPPALSPLPAPSAFMPAYIPISSRVIRQEEPAPKYPKELVPALMEALKDSDTEVVQAAAKGLSTLGSEALPALMEGLQAKDRAIRQNSALAIGKMGQRGADAIPALLKCLQDGESTVRREAARAIAAIVAEPSVTTAPPHLPPLPVDDVTLPTPPGT